MSVPPTGYELLPLIAGSGADADAEVMRVPYGSGSVSVRDWKHLPFFNLAREPEFDQNPIRSMTSILDQAQCGELIACPSITPIARHDLFSLRSVTLQLRALNGVCNRLGAGSP